MFVLLFDTRDVDLANNNNNNSTKLFVFNVQRESDEMDQNMDSKCDDDDDYT